MAIKFGPAGLGPVKTAVKVLEQYHKLGLKACEIAFTYSVYIKPEETAMIKAKAESLGIQLSIHAPYYINLNSKEKHKIQASKQRILSCCRIGQMLGAKKVVFHPGYYTEDKEQTYQIIKNNILELNKKIKENSWNIQLAPETTGKINVFGSIEEISKLAKETSSSFCLDFAHILAREKQVDYEKIKKLFPQNDWHVHFSGINYNEKGERNHLSTKAKEWKDLLENLPKNKIIAIINESPTLVEDSVEGLKIYKKIS